MKSEDILMDPEYRRKTRQIRVIEIGFLSFGVASFVALVGLLTLAIK